MTKRLLAAAALLVLAIASTACGTGHVLRSATDTIANREFDWVKVGARVHDGPPRWVELDLMLVGLVEVQAKASCEGTLAALCEGIPFGALVDPEFNVALPATTTATTTDRSGLLVAHPAPLTSIRWRARR